MIKRVLLPVDFSPRDAAAAHYVNQLQRKIPFETILLHVVPPPDYETAVLEAGGPLLQELLDTRRRLASEKLSRACLSELEGLPVEKVLRDGFPSEEIVEVAGERQCDLIVMPTRGYGPFRRFLLGSVVSKVLHDSPIPILTGAHMEEPKLDDIAFATIAAAVDLSADSADLLNYAARLAQSLHAKLVVVHAVAELSGHIGLNFSDKDDTSFEVAARGRLEELVKDLPIHADIFVESGDTAETLSDLTKRSHADLLVIGRTSARGLGRMWADASSIIRESGIPVLSV